MAAARIVAQLRANLGGSELADNGKEFLSETEALRLAVEMYESKIVDLERSNVDYAKVQLQLQVIRNLLAVEQKRSHDLQCTVSAYQCSIAAVYTDVDPFHPENNTGAGVSEEATQAKAAAELDALMGQFDDIEETSTGTSGDQTATGQSAGGRSESPASPKASGGGGSTGPDPDAEAKIVALTNTIKKMKATILSIHAEKTMHSEETQRAKADLQKLQLQFTTQKKGLQDERNKRQDQLKEATTQIAEQKQRVAETEHRARVQLQRVEAKNAKELNAVQRERDALQREVDRLVHFEERHQEMESEVRAMRAEVNRIQKACDDQVKNVESRFGAIKYYAQKTFADMSDTICDALPDNHDLHRIPLPVEQGFLALMQLQEPELVNEMDSATHLVSYAAKLLQPIVRDDRAIAQFERQEGHFERVDILKEQIQRLLLGFENLTSDSDVEDTLELMEEVVGDEEYLQEVLTDAKEEGIREHTYEMKNPVHPVHPFESSSDSGEDDEQPPFESSDEESVQEGPTRTNQQRKSRRRSTTTSVKSDPSVGGVDVPEGGASRKQRRQRPDPPPPRERAERKSGTIRVNPPREKPEERARNPGAQDDSSGTNQSTTILTVERERRKSNVAFSVADDSLETRKSATASPKPSSKKQKASSAANAPPPPSIPGVAVPTPASRIEEHQKALGLMAEMNMRRDPVFDEEEEKAMKEREENLQRGKEALEAARNVCNMKLPPTKQLKPLDRLKLDRGSQFGQPRRQLPDPSLKKAHRAGGNQGRGRLVTNQPSSHAVKRDGPPVRQETPDLAVGEGEQKKSLQKDLNRKRR